MLTFPPDGDAPEHPLALRGGDRHGYAPRATPYAKEPTEGHGLGTWGVPRGAVDSAPQKQTPGSLQPRPWFVPWKGATLSKRPVQKRATREGQCKTVPTFFYYTSCRSHVPQEADRCAATAW